MLSISKLKEAGIAADIRKKINECIDAITALRIADGPGYRVRRTAKGQILGIDRKSETTQQASGMVFKGEWSASDNYIPGDVVVVRGGLASGTYICILTANAGTASPSDPPTDPSLGIYWLSLARGNTSASW